jgi:peptidyl-prolyl cis-trans isomerase A (cyclophilin A)
MNRATTLASVVLALLTLSCADEGKAPRSIPTGTVPDTFRVAFETTKGRFVVEAYRDWSPLGVKRFYELASLGAFDDNGFFRVIPNFIVQFGVPGRPKFNAALDSVLIPDEPRVAKNLRGTIAYAHEGPGTRSHQVYINRRDADHLDSAGFVPFGRVIEGMSVVDSINSEYRQKPDFHLIATLGNKYLQRMFPRLDYVKTAVIITK